MKWTELFEDVHVKHLEGKIKFQVIFFSYGRCLCSIRSSFSMQNDTIMMIADTWTVCYTLLLTLRAEIYSRTNVKCQVFHLFTARIKLDWVIFGVFVCIVCLFLCSQVNFCLFYLSLCLFILSVYCCKSISVFVFFCKHTKKARTSRSHRSIKVQISWLYVSIMAICLVIHTVLL